MCWHEKVWTASPKGLDLKTGLDLSFRPDHNRSDKISIRSLVTIIQVPEPKTPTSKPTIGRECARRFVDKGSTCDHKLDGNAKMKRCAPFAPAISLQPEILRLTFMYFADLFASFGPTWRGLHVLYRPIPISTACTAFSRNPSRAPQCTSAHSLCRTTRTCAK